MKRLRILSLLLVAPALLACSLSALLNSSTPVPAAESIPPASQDTAVPLNQLEAEAQQVVVAFLNAVKSDPSGQRAQQYLVAEMTTSPVELAGVQEGVPEFQLSAVTFNPDGKRAAVDATLLYAEPSNRRFTLLRENETWKIESVAVLNGESGYPSTPEEVVMAFLLAYQETPDEMSQYLSAERLAQLPAGGAVGMLDVRGELEGYLVDSAAMNPSDPPRAAITVTVRTGGEDLSRVFILVREDGDWKIEDVTAE